MVGEREGGLMLQEEKNSIWIDSDREQRHQTRCKAFTLPFIRSLDYRRLHTHHRYTGEQSAFVTLGGNIFKQTVM